MTARETSRRNEAAGRPRWVLSLATCTSQFLPQKKYVHHVAIRCHRPGIVRPQLRASLQDLTPDRKIIRHRFTLGADNYVHNRTNYAVSNKSLSTLTPRYYRYTPLYSRVRLQQNPHHRPPLKRHTRKHTRPTQRVLDCPGPPEHYGLLCSMRHTSGGTPPPRTCRTGAQSDGVASSANGPEKLHLFAFPCVADAADMHISAGRPACVSPADRNTMCATGAELLHVPLLFEWPNCSVSQLITARGFPQYCPKRGHGRFLPHPYPFITRYHHPIRSYTHQSHRVTKYGVTKQNKSIHKILRQPSLVSVCISQLQFPTYVRVPLLKGLRNRKFT
jgi:hypothetical protein